MKNVMDEKGIMTKNESSRCAKYRYPDRFNMSARRRGQLKPKFPKMLSLLQVFNLSPFSLSPAHSPPGRMLSSLSPLIVDAQFFRPLKV